MRVVRRREGNAAIVYRRRLTENGQERLERVAALSPIAFSAGAQLLRCAVRATEGAAAPLSFGAFHPLDPDWGAKVACYSLVSAGLRDADRLHRASQSLLHLDGIDAAWWLGLMADGRRTRAVRALRVLTEAVE